MPRIFPFKALRPNPDFINLITAKSTDFPNHEDLVHEIRTNSFTFHHVTKSHLSYSGAYQEPEKFLPFANQYIKEMKKKGVLIKEESEALYIYEQVRKDGKSFKGIIALCSIADYKENRIKKHEEIRPSRLKFLVELFKTTKVMGEPTLLAHNGQVDLDSFLGTQLYSFTTLDDKKHTIHRIDNPEDIKSLQECLGNIPDFYIADGHHRSASTEEFNTQVNQLDNDKSMCFIIQEDILEILPFHRLIKPVVPMAADYIIAELSSVFKVTKSEKSLYEIKERNTFGLYVGKQWYKLIPKTVLQRADIIEMEELIVKGVFGIEDSRTDSQISFHPFTSGDSLLINLVDTDTFSIAITSKACGFSEVRAIADANKTMPPKSTYIEPKLRSGMIIQEFGVIK